MGRLTPVPPRVSCNQTAYFQIPKDIKHGDFLVCSYPACRNRGVKFLYCSFCKDAVAKRNFRNRHYHEDYKKEGNSGSHRTENPDVKMVDSARAVGAGTKEGNGQQQGVALISGNSSYPSGESQSGSGSTVTNSDEAGRKRPASGFAMRTDLKTKLAKLDPNRKEAWDLLLASRPSTAQSNKMSAWLMQIMAVSDKTQPLPEDPLEAVLKTVETSESPNNDPAASSMSNDSGSSTSNDDSNETSSDSTQSNGLASDVAQHSRKRKANSCLSSQTTDGSSNDESNETASDTQSNEYSDGRHSSEGSSDTQSNDSSSDNQERTTSNDSSSES